MMQRLFEAAERQKAIVGVVPMDVVRNRFVSHCEFETPLSFGPVEVVHGRNQSEERMGFGQRGIEVEGFACLGAQVHHRFARRDEPVKHETMKKMPEFRVRQRKLRVELDGSFEMRLRALHELRCDLLSVVQGLQIVLVRGKFGRIPPKGCGRGGQRDLQCRSDCCSNVILNCENIAHLPVVALRPEMAAVGGGDELGGDADATAGFSNAAFEDIGHAKGFSNSSDIFVLAFERKGGCAGDAL